MKLMIEHYAKSYGESVVFTDTSISFEEGKIYGLLGRNGSGKSTFFNCLDQLIPYDSGEFYLLEEATGEHFTLSSDNLGLVLTDPMLPEFLTGYEFIKAYMEITGSPELANISDYFDLISLSAEDQNKLIKDYSMGMKNKIQILMCLISKPKVILLDEPLTSFDIIVASEIKDLLKSLKETHIIIFSTHILELARSMCDEIVVINNKTMEAIDSSIIQSAEFEERIVEILKNEENNQQGDN